MTERDSVAGIFGPLRIALLIFLLPSLAGAVDRGKARYAGGSLTGVLIDASGPIQLDDADKLVFAPRTGRIEIPWTAVEATEYRQTGTLTRSRVGLAILTPYSLLFTKGRKHLVTLSFKDARDVRQVAVFEFDKGDIRAALSLIKARTGRPVACEGEDVGDPMEACAVAVVADVAGEVQGRADEPASAPPTEKMTGPRVRILAPDMSVTPIQGELLGSDEATITIRTTHRSILDRTYGKTLRLPRASVTLFERSVRPGRQGLGAAVGFLVGGALGIAVLSQDGNNPWAADSGGGLAVAGLALAGGFVGAMAAPGEKWVAEEPRRVTVGPARSMGRGVRFSMSVRF